MFLFQPFKFSFPFIDIVEMSDPKNPNIKSRSTSNGIYMYQRELFWKDNQGELPPFTTEPSDLEELAKKTLSQGGW